jgi:hypothetical protein
MNTEPALMALDPSIGLINISHYNHDKPLIGMMIT